MFIFSVLCRGGEIGRRARLKIWLGQPSAGSIPALGTRNYYDTASNLDLLTNQTADISYNLRILHYSKESLKDPLKFALGL